ncbi:ATP-binding cassette domain-containing protein [Amycolatopsis sp. CA-230715]|uniref:ATP-binding cassette domain-containing protein n=1 Tax=Amycolatopsis sp. CA-230715 TaxID=2745196 RepID=UPI001C02939A|nr:ATP-binding cassette domain-containing protein [Amycolatopsis sp. CA-230715]QWF82823.1 putative ABC transporter ATP-binding protein [Amycolatopsis sp. CA-230715]
MVAAELRDVTVHIDTGRWSETVLDAVSLTVPEGRITALIGESGCGKSMTAAALTGRLPASAASSGQVRVTGTLGYVPQSGVTAFKPDQAVGTQLRELERLHRRWSVERACTAAGYPEDVAELLPQQHSGGQIQRAALAAALLPSPELLVADEPTASLDAENAYRVWKTLREYADEGAAVLVITQDVPLLAAIGAADRMVVLRAGRVVAADSAAAVAALDDQYVRGFFREG